MTALAATPVHPDATPLRPLSTQHSPSPGKLGEANFDPNTVVRTWDWADASGVPVIIQNLPPGHQWVLVELADANHHILDHRVVEFSVPDVGQRSQSPHTA